MIIKHRRLLIVISICVSLILILTLLIGLFTVRQFNNIKEGNDTQPVSEGSVKKDDNFIGPEASVHPEDRDGVFDALAVDPNNPDIVYLGTENNSAFKSTDGGKTWTWLRKGIYHDDRSYPEFYGVQINPSDTNTVYAITTNGPMPASSEHAAGFYISYDGGSSWERRINGLPSTGITSLTTIDGILFAGLDGAPPSHHSLKGKDVQGGLFKSEDEGKTWIEAINEQAYTDIRYAELVARGSSIYASILHWGDNNYGSILKSSDKGETWSKISPEGFFPVHYDADMYGNVIYATACDEEFQTQKSTDGGKTWQKLPIFTCGKIRHSPHHDKTLIFALSDRIMKTTDGFESYHEVFKLDDYAIDDIEFAPSDDKIVYLAGEGYRVYKSTDGGENFSQIADLRKFVEEQR